MNCEVQSVKYVELSISKTDYLEPHINTNDREPSWDGDVEVYRKAGDRHAKKDLILKVPVQIKGHKSDKPYKQTITHPVEYSDMKNYLHMGGTIFFVVYVDESGDSYQIYYAEFLPYELKRLLREHKSQNMKTKNIRLKVFPQNKEDITELFLRFARDMKKQRAAIYSDEVSLKDIAKSEHIPELSFGFPYIPMRDVTPFDLLLRGNMYLYAKMPYGVELPVEHIQDVDMITTTVPSSVTANGKVFYDKYRVVFNRDYTEVCFGKSIKSIINRGNMTEQKFSFKISGTLSERICDEKFIIEALSVKQFEVNGKVYSLNEAKPEELASFNLPLQKEYLNWLLTIQKILDALDVKEDLDCSELSSKDEEKLYILEKAIIDGEAVPLKDSGNLFAFFNIANLKILIYVLKSDDGKFNICNYNDAPGDFKVKGNDGNEYPTSFYVLLKKDTILKSCNLNFEKMLAQLQKIIFSEVYSSQLVLLLLELLGAYDESESKRKDILDAAIRLAKWLKDKDPFTPNEVLTLNYYQAIKRSRALEQKEICELLQLIESKSVSEEVFTAAYLLLDNQEAAKIHYEMMESEIRNIFHEYPIFRFWKEETRSAL